jgi:hypothetical protein
MATTKTFAKGGLRAECVRIINENVGMHQGIVAPLIAEACGLDLGEAVAYYRANIKRGICLQKEIIEDPNKTVRSAKPKEPKAPKAPKEPKVAKAPKLPKVPKAPKMPKAIGRKATVLRVEDADENFEVMWVGNGTDMYAFKSSAREAAEAIAAMRGWVAND